MNVRGCDSPAAHRLLPGWLASSPSDREQSSRQFEPASPLLYHFGRTIVLRAYMDLGVIENRMLAAVVTASCILVGHVFATDTGMQCEQERLCQPDPEVDGGGTTDTASQGLKVPLASSACAA